MKRRITALTLALVLALSLVPAAAAQEEQPQRGTLTYSDHILPQYEAAGSFSEGLAAVKKDGKWGYIDTQGATVIPFEYDLAFQFNEGLAVVGKLYRTLEQEDYQYNPDLDDYELVTVDYHYYELGFIDQENSLTWFTAPYRYDPETWEDLGPDPYLCSYQADASIGESLLFHNGYISLDDMDSPDSFLYNTQGQREWFGQEEYGISYYGWQVNEGIVITGYYAAEGGSQALYDINTGKEIAIQDPAGYSREEDYFWYSFRPVNQGISPVFVEGYTDEGEYFSRLGFLRVDGSWAIQPRANWDAFMLSGIQTTYQVFGDTGVALVRNTDGLWGAIDKSGGTVLPFQYEALRPYSFGLAAFARDGKYGYLDEQGNEVIPAQYVITSGFGSLGCAAAYDGENAFLIDAQGNRILGSEGLNPDTYFDMSGDIPTTYSPGEYVVVEEDGKYGYGHIEYLPPLPQPEDMSSWAYDLVVAAIEEDLVPVYMQNLYLNDIDRADFCSLAIRAVEEVTGQDIEDVVLEKTGRSLAQWVSEYPFQDVSSSTVVAAYALGIVDGRGNGIFDPYASITRQEAAVMLRSAARALGMDTTQAADLTFADSDSVEVWAQEAVGFVYRINVMSGTDNNQFSPIGSYTREQSFITIYRLFQAVLGQA